MHKVIKILILIIFLTGCTSNKKLHACNINKYGKCSDFSLALKSKKEVIPLPDISYKPKHMAENIQAIWIASYEDEEGNFYEPSYVYVVINKDS